MISKRDGETLSKSACMCVNYDLQKGTIMSDDDIEPDEETKCSL